MVWLWKVGEWKSDSFFDDLVKKRIWEALPLFEVVEDGLMRRYVLQLQIVLQRPQKTKYRWESWGLRLSPGTVTFGWACGLEVSNPDVGFGCPICWSGLWSSFGFVDLFV